MNDPKKSDDGKVFSVLICTYGFDPLGNVMDIDSYPDAKHIQRPSPKRMTTKHNDTTIIDYEYVLCNV